MNLKIEEFLQHFFRNGLRPIVLAPCLLLQVATSKEVRDIGRKDTAEELNFAACKEKKFQVFLASQWRRINGT